MKLSSKLEASDDSEASGDEDVDETKSAIPQNVDKVIKDFEEELVSITLY